MSRDTRPILARAALIGARDRAQQALAAARGQGAGTQETITLRGAIEDQGAGRWLLPPADPNAFADDEVLQRRAELREAVRRAVAYREEAMRAQLQLQGPYLLALSGHGHPSTTARDRADYEAAERAKVAAEEEERAARITLNRFEAEVTRRALARERAVIAARDAERAVGRQEARRGADRGVVAAALARAQSGPQPVTFRGKPYKH